MMNLLLWLTVGALIGWAALRFFDMNHNRSTPVCCIIGATAAVIGGKSLAPLLRAVKGPDDGFEIFAVVVAVATAVVCIIAADMLSRRYDI